MPAACFLIGLACGVVGAFLFLNGSRNESSMLSETGGAGRIGSAKTGAVAPEPSRLSQPKAVASEKHPQPMPTFGPTLGGHS